MLQCVLLSWIVFLVIEYFTFNVKQHRFLKKSAVWVFLPLINETANRVQSNVSFLVLFILMVLVSFSGEKKSTRAIICQIGVICCSITSLLFYTPYGQVIYKFLFS